ncbi:MAG: hypothetical protein V3V08_02600 [Nannocystaceae bacterium]
MARKRTDYWQSFSDLGMGLVGLLVLMLVVLVASQAKEARTNRVEAEALSEFALELLTALEDASELQARQDGVEQWLGAVFDETSCQLRYNAATGKLESRGGAASSELYQPGEIVLSDGARTELQSCKEAFLRLAACLSPNLGVRDEACPYADSARWAREVVAFREDIEALVLQGNTDRVRFPRAQRIQGLERPLSSLSASFVGNAYLGGERARQALGHLLEMVEAGQLDTGDPTTGQLEVLMSRIRLESPSFGRYQVGPRHWRTQDAVGCGEKDDCREARNLALRLRWSRVSLRKPLRSVIDTFCREWNTEGGHFRRSIIDSSRGADAHRLCGQRTAVGEREAGESANFHTGRSG